jgi:hypothetical protein
MCCRIAELPGECRPGPCRGPVAKYAIVLAYAASQKNIYVFNAHSEGCFMIRSFGAVFIAGAFLAACSPGIETVAPGSNSETGSSTRMAGASLRRGKHPHTQNGSIDLRAWFGAQIGNATPPQMLCLGTPPPDNPNSSYQCKSYIDNGPDETFEFDSGGTKNWMGVSSYVHQNPPSPGSSNIFLTTGRTYDSQNGFKCFAQIGKPCDAPMSNPAGAPELISDLPIVPWSAVLAASNVVAGCGSSTVGACKTNLTPTGPIAGELVTSGAGTTWNGPAPGATPDSDKGWQRVVTMDPTDCSQGASFNYYEYTAIVKVQNVDFGGTIGVQDAIIKDTWAVNGQHGERYYAVWHTGVVRAAINTPTSQYTHTYSYERPDTLAAPTPVPGATGNGLTWCPQGGVTVMP